MLIQSGGAPLLPWRTRQWRRRTWARRKSLHAACIVVSAPAHAPGLPRPGRAQQTAKAQAAYRAIDCNILPTHLRRWLPLYRVVSVGCLQHPAAHTCRWSGDHGPGRRHRGSRLAPRPRCTPAGRRRRRRAAAAVCTSVERRRRRSRQPTRSLPSENTVVYASFWIGRGRTAAAASRVAATDLSGPVARTPASQLARIGSSTWRPRAAAQTRPGSDDPTPFEGLGIECDGPLCGACSVGSLLYIDTGRTGSA
jgi:hypothetical protein